MTLGRALIAVGVALMVVVPPLSLLHPWGDLRATTQPNGTVLAGTNVPAEVREVFEARCSDCHSGETKWPEYSRIAPVSMPFVTTASVCAEPGLHSGWSQKPFLSVGSFHSLGTARKDYVLRLVPCDPI